MKKIFVIILAVIMLLSLAACGTKENTPDNGGNSTVTSQPDKSADDGKSDKPENDAKPSKEWPIDKFEWTGSGKIVDVSDLSNESRTWCVACIDTATLEEFVAYIASLKAAGLTFTRTANMDEEPAIGYDENDDRYLWQGENSDGWNVSVTLYKEVHSGITETFDGYEYLAEVAIKKY